MPCSVTNLAELKEQILRYWRATNRYVSVVYCLLREVNDSDEDADALIRLVTDLPCKVNLLNYNAVEGTPYKPATEARFERFRTRLRAGGVSVLHRKSLGTSIKAGCGQLGCVEAYSSAYQLARHAEELIDQGRTSTLKAKRDAGTELVAEDIVEAAKTGDELAVAAAVFLRIVFSVGCLAVDEDRSATGVGGPHIGSTAGRV